MREGVMEGGRDGRREKVAGREEWMEHPHLCCSLCS